MKILIKLVITAVALWVAALVVPNVDLGGHGSRKIEALALVAIIFGVVNAILKPVAKPFERIIGCLGTILAWAVVVLIVNGLLFLLTSYLAGKLNLPFHVHGFEAAVLGALLVGFVSWALSLIFDRN